MGKTETGRGRSLPFSARPKRIVICCVPAAIVAGTLTVVRIQRIEPGLEERHHGYMNHDHRWDHDPQRDERRYDEHHRDDGRR